MYLAGWKETFPAGKDVPGRVSKDTRQRLQTALSPEKAARDSSKKRSLHVHPMP
jgi:hypothetical protein